MGRIIFYSQGGYYSPSDYSLLDISKRAALKIELSEWEEKNYPPISNNLNECIG